MNNLSEKELEEKIEQKALKEFEQDLDNWVKERYEQDWATSEVIEATKIERWNRWLEDRKKWRSGKIAREELKKQESTKRHKLLSKPTSIADLHFDIGIEVEVHGFLRDICKKGKLIFIDLADHTGSIQVLIKDPSLFWVAYSKKESIFLIKGKLQNKTSKDKEVEFSEWEILCSSAQPLNQSSKDSPFPINDPYKKIPEELRLQYRYLDLRRPAVKKNIKLRSDIKFAMHSFLKKQQFYDIDTPVLSVSSKEGAAAFNTFVDKQNKFEFSLSQSPQLFKQLLMIAGFNRYFQFAKVFRKEDLRSDRQFEFTQLDLEISYSNQEYLFALIEEMMHEVNKQVFNDEFEISFKTVTYKDAYEKYGSDKPDLRHDLELIKIAEIDEEYEGTESCAVYGKYEAFAVSSKWPLNKMWNQLSPKPSPELFLLKKGDNEYWQKVLDTLASHHLIYKNNLLTDKHYVVAIFHTSKRLKILSALGSWRNFIACEDGLKMPIERNRLAFVWVVDWPLFEFNWVQQKDVIAHHLFTKPQHDSTNIDVKKDVSAAYDLVLNGTELASGSQRNHDFETQKSLFRAAGLEEKEMQDGFGWFLEALQYGVPPHMGIGIGFDRLMQKILETESIRDVIAFPKNTHGNCKMTNSPRYVSETKKEDIN